MEYNGRNEILTVDDVCDWLSTSKNIIYELLRSNEIKGFKITRVWKISRISVEEYIERKRQEGYL